MASVIMPQAASTPAARRTSRGSAGAILLRVALISAVLYLALPLFATVAFSLATVWSRTILPEGYTLEWYKAAVMDDRFWPTTIHTLQATLGAAIISPLLVVPALLAVHLRAPKWKPWLEFLSIVPWALPGVVLALAMIRAYISPFNVSRPGLLILTYVLLSLPFMFRSIDASLSAIDARTLAEAAQMLGAGWFDIGRRILLPGIMPGLMSGVLLIAALGAGEFALASLMAGSGWKTFPIYQAQAQGVDGRIASALAIIGLLYVLAVSLLLLFVAGRNRGRAGDPGMPLVNK
jgi:putative spermidine/putrescine transport system permease protein